MPPGPCITLWAGGIETSKIFRTKEGTEAVRRYKVFVAEGVGQGLRPELVGSGSIRSLGGAGPRCFRFGD